MASTVEKDHAQHSAQRSAAITVVSQPRIYARDAPCTETAAQRGRRAPRIGAVGVALVKRAVSTARCAAGSVVCARRDRRAVDAMHHSYTMGEHAAPVAPWGAHNGRAKKRDGQAPCAGLEGRGRGPRARAKTARKNKGPAQRAGRPWLPRQCTGESTARLPRTGRAAAVRARTGLDGAMGVGVGEGGEGPVHSAPRRRRRRGTLACVSPNTLLRVCACACVSLNTLMWACNA